MSPLESPTAAVHAPGGLPDIVAGWGSPRRLLVVACAFGLAGGLLEDLVVAIRRFGLHKIFPASHNFVWMIPIADLALALVTAVLLILVLRLLRLIEPAIRRRGLRVDERSWTIVSLAFVSLLGSLYAIDGMDRRASSVLALGVAVQIARMLAGAPERWWRGMGRVAGWLALGTVTLGAGTVAWRTAREWRADAGVSRDSEGSPNVLLIIMDTVRKKSLSLYGNRRLTTPVLDSLGAQGVVFDQAWSASPWTLPSHATMFTGRLPHEHGVNWAVPLDDKYPTLAEALHREGFRTAGFVANTIYCSYLHGLDRGFIHYEDFPVSLGQMVVGSAIGRVIAGNTWWRRRIGYQRVLNRKTAAEVTDEALAWLGRSDSRPYFAFLNYMDAHEPYLPPTAFGPRRDAHAPFSHSPIDGFRLGKPRMSPAEVQAEIGAYEGSIAYIDREVGRLLDGLRQQGRLRNTMVIVAADHGEQIGEHQLFGHGNSLYGVLVNVPLLVSFPGRIPLGRRISRAVSLRDLAATVLDLVGGRDSTSIPGSSWRATWERPGANTLPEEPILVEAARNTVTAQRRYPLVRGDMQAMLEADHYFIRSSEGSQLFDVATDPEESQDLSGTTAGIAFTKHMNSILDRELGAIRR